MDEPAAAAEDAEDFEPAAEHLQADIVSRQGSAAAKTGRTIANLVAGFLTGEAGSGPSTTDLIVTRRDSGGEILHIAAGSIIDADQLLQRVRQDLATKSVSDFLAEWRLSEQDEGAPSA